MIKDPLEELPEVMQPHPVSPPPQKADGQPGKHPDEAKRQKEALKQKDAQSAPGENRPAVFQAEWNARANVRKEGNVLRDETEVESPKEAAAAR